MRVCVVLCSENCVAVKRNHHNEKSSLPGFTAAFDIFRLTTLAMDVEKSRDSHTYIFIHMAAWMAGWLVGWHLPDLKIKGKCDRNKIDIATPLHNIPYEVLAIHRKYRTRSHICY